MLHRLTDELPDWSEPLLHQAGECGEDVATALRLAVEIGRLLPNPGRGGTVRRWAVLAALARRNVTVARVVEAHVDALAILAEAGHRAAPGTWGVFAAEAPGHRLEALVDGDAGLTVDGAKAWCSLAEHLDHALVTAHRATDRLLVEIDLTDSRVTTEPSERWVARGLRTVTSLSISCARLPARAVGGANWYLERDGFAWGGMGVAACWYGGALGILDALTARARAHGDDQVIRTQLGAVDRGLHAAACTLADAAAQIDGGRAYDDAGRLLAARVRAVVADAAELTLQQAAHALGPTPLAIDPAYAARVADLQMYVRQHHGSRDLAALGELAIAVQSGIGRDDQLGYSGVQPS